MQCLNLHGVTHQYPFLLVKILSEKMFISVAARLFVVLQATTTTTTIIMTPITTTGPGPVCSGLASLHAMGQKLHLITAPSVAGDQIIVILPTVLELNATLMIL